MSDEIAAGREGVSERGGWIAAIGAIAGAALASSCCVVPLLFVLLGVSGAWIGNLTALEPYKPYFAAIALIFIGLGFWQVYFRTPSACADDSYCARPRSAILIKTVLWMATALVLVALTTDWWAPYFY